VEVAVAGSTVESQLAALPLSDHELVHTHDVDEARTAVAGVFCSHQLLPLDGLTSLDTRLHSVRIGKVGLHYLDYGAEVRIAPGQLQGFFLVQIPVAGRAEIVCGKERIISDAGLASVPSPDENLTMRWGSGNVSSSSGSTGRAWRAI